MKRFKITFVVLTVLWLLLVVLVGYSFAQTMDTVRVNENITNIKNDRSGTFIFQSGQNYRDPVDGKFKKRNLSDIRLRREIDTHADTTDYEVRDNLIRRFNKELTHFSVEDEFGNYVEYSLLGIGKVRSEAVMDGNRVQASIDDNYDITLYNTPKGIKEEITLHNSSAPTVFRYRFRSNRTAKVSGNSILFGEDFVSHIYAYDANEDEVPVSIEITGSILTIDIDVASAVYPITIDPTVTWQHGADFGNDTFIYAHATQIMNNHGTNVELQVQSDVPAGEDFKTHILIKFDSLSILSSDAVVSSAMLVFTINSIGLNLDSTIVIYPLTRLFTEGTENVAPGIANWDSSSIAADNGGIDSSWTTPGGDYDITGSFASFVRTGKVNGDTVGVDVTDLAQDAITNSSGYFGWLLRFVTEVTAQASDVRLRSSDHATASSRPKLIVTYTLPSAAPTGDIITRALGSVLYRGRGQELAADRNKGKVINAVTKKGSG